jgi:hypothetical protein
MERSLVVTVEFDFFRHTLLSYKDTHADCERLLQFLLQGN